MKKTLSLFLSVLMLLSVFSVTAFAAEAPILKDIKCTFAGVEITWNAAKDAANYVVYRAEGNGGEEAVIATTTQTKYVDKAVSENVSYTYKVTVQAKDGTFTTPDNAASLTITFKKPICKHEKADWVIVQNATVFAAGSKEKVCPVCKEVLETQTIKQLVTKTPAIKTITNQVYGVAMSWELVEGATSYYVLRRPAGCAWELLTITTSTKFVDTTVESGKYYNYTIRAYNDAGLSPYQTGKLVKFVAAPSNIKAGNVTGGVYVNWNAVQGASSYSIYRKNLADGQWAYIGNTKETKFIDTKAVAAEDYVYTVRAISGGIYSNFFAGAAIKRLENPVFVSSVSSAEGITTSWKPVEGAKGYNVYRKTANTGWILIGKVNNTRSTAYLDKSTVKGVTYTYTVRAINGSSMSYFYNGISCKDVH